MVSENNSPPDGLFPDPTRMALPEIGTLAAGAPAPVAIASAVDDPNKKIRKPYTITKSRQSWTEAEHDKFLEALQLFDRDWKKIEAFIGSKTVIQIRSHAQKYFLKVQKSGTSEHLPPPRPKRKAAHPYPQKAPKNETGLAASSWTKNAQTISFSQNFQGFVYLRKQYFSESIYLLSLAGHLYFFSCWLKFLYVLYGPVPANKCSSSAESTQKKQTVADASDQGNNGLPLRVLPDFAQVYGFIGSVFDPNATNHLQKLKMMDHIDVETVLLLMRNLTINLTSPDFEDHRSLLSSYEIDADTNDRGITVESFSNDQSETVA